MISNHCFCFAKNWYKNHPLDNKWFLFNWQLIIHQNVYSYFTKYHSYNFIRKWLTKHSVIHYTSLSCFLWWVISFSPLLFTVVGDLVHEEVLKLKKINQLTINNQLTISITSFPLVLGFGHVPFHHKLVVSSHSQSLH